MTVFGRYLLAVTFGLALGVGLTVGAGLVLGVRPGALTASLPPPTPLPTPIVPTPRPIQPAPQLSPAAGPVALDENAVADLFERVSPSVVNVSVRVPNAALPLRDRTPVRDQAPGSWWTIRATF